MEGKRRREDPKNGITKLDSTPYLLLSLSLSPILLYPTDIVFQPARYTSSSP
jgi:hypothetical protein